MAEAEGKAATIRSGGPRKPALVAPKRVRRGGDPIETWLAGEPHGCQGWGPGCP
jgi:hypothetical protein